MPENPLQVRLEAIENRPGHFTLTFNSSQYPVTVRPETSVAFGDWLRRLDHVLIGSKDPSGQLSAQELFHHVGTWLWRALLPDDAPQQERDQLAQLLRTGWSPLLLILPEILAELPWELLSDPQTSTGGFLALRRPLIRFNATLPLKPPIPYPLRVLLLISSPPTLGEDSRVDVESERAAVEQATHDMREAGFLHLYVEDIVTPKRVQQALIRFKPHVVHYIGHGGYNTTSGGVLLWEDDQGKELPFSAEQIANLLRPRNLSAVVLHGCKTGRSNARTDVGGVAAALTKEGIPAVLAQQANFTYESSQRASAAWYPALTAGQSFAEALFEVRQALNFADRPDWAVPLLSGGPSSLVSILDDTSPPTSADPLLSASGAAADVPTPTASTVFVGRHSELRRLHLMLENAPGSGPVIALITGPGGVGKSTLATQAVTRYGGKYKATLTLSCKGYQSVELFLQRIAQFLQRHKAPGFLEQILPDPKLSTEVKIEEAILALNQAGPFLLIVDNLESVQHDEDRTIRDPSLLYLLQNLLTNLRSGRVLITGRYAVKDLLPQGKFAAHLLHLDLGDLSTYETNQLLLRHPSLAQLGETVRKTLIDEFGGLPYVYDILSRDSNSQSLARLIHDVQERITKARQQRSAQEWHKVRQEVIEFAALEEVTQNRLSEASRLLLTRLGVLQRPFPLEALEQGLGTTRGVWQPLLDWSLLHYDAQEQRYHLHSLTKHYLEGSWKELDLLEIQMQLATWYKQYADKDSHDLTDYLEAHRLLRASGRVHEAGKLVLQLAEALRRFGLYPLLRDLCTQTLNDIQMSDEELVATMLYELGIIAQLQGDYDAARRLSLQSLEIDERLGDQSGRANSLHQLGTIAQLQGDYPEARRLLLQALEIKERLGDQSGRANSLHQLGTIAQDQGDYDNARRLFLQSLETFEHLGDQLRRATSLHQLGIIAQRQRDYDNAHHLFLQSLEIKERLGDQRGRAISLHQLGNIALLQENYDDARRFFLQSLEIEERLGDQHGRAKALHQLGIIARLQGDYDDARRLSLQSLETFERLSDQSGQASALGQLGTLDYEQEDLENALRHTIQAYLIFRALRSPSQTHVHNTMIKIRSRMDEETFMAEWHMLAGTLPLPDLSPEKTRRVLLQIVDFIQAPTWEESKQFLESHLELLQPEIDELLQEFATQQEDDGARKAIEEHRLLLLQCREKGIEAAFLERKGVKQPYAAFITELNSICTEVIATLKDRNAERQEALAIRIEQMLKGHLPMEDSRTFLLLLIAWLRRQETQVLAEQLQPPLSDAYTQMLAAVEQEQREDPEKSDGLTIEDLPGAAAGVLLQGTAEQQQQFAASLIEAQQQLGIEEAALGKFLGCLATALQGVTPEIALLEPPFTDLWQAFQDALNPPPAQ